MQVFCSCRESSALGQTPARELDKFIETHLLPDTPFRMRVRKAVHEICRFLKERCFRGASHPVRVSKVVKGGSSGKGTTLRGRSDADLVVFLSELRSFREQLDRRGEFIQEIRRQLEAFQIETGAQLEIQASRWEHPRVLSFAFCSPELDDKVEFDVLPAFDVLGPWAPGPEPHLHGGHRPDPRIYVRLIDECTRLGKEGEFSPCFTELQRAFLRRRPAKLKSLIRLVKHWYQLCRERLGKPLPPQYALELLTVYAWERGCGETNFSTAQGFRTVLELVMGYQELCICWNEYYDSEDHPVIGEYLRRQLKQPRPVILDPADPTGNVAAGAGGDGWRRLAQDAAGWLRCPCMKNWDGSPVSAWDTRLQGESSWDTGLQGASSWDTGLQGASSWDTGLQGESKDSWTCAIH